MKTRFDAVVMFATVREMAPRLAGGRIRRIAQLSPDLFLLTVFRPSSLSSRPHETPLQETEETSTPLPEVRLIIGLDAAGARIHLAERAYGTAQTPTSFCMQLRKHLEGTRVAALHTASGGLIGAPATSSSASLERIAVFDIMPRPDLEAGALVVALLPTGRSLLLLDTAGRVLGDMRHRLRKGTPYAVPDAVRPMATELRGDALVEAVLALDEPLALEKALPRVTFGIGAVYGREIAVRAGLDARRPLQRADGSTLARAWDAFWEQLMRGPLQPTSVRTGDDEQVLLPFPFMSLTGLPTRAHSSMSRMVEDAFADVSGQAGLDEMRRGMLAAVLRHRDRAERRIAAQEEDLKEAGRADTYRLYGELLTANLYRVPARAASVTLEDYTQDGSPALEVKLNPDLSPQENARAWFTRYKKAKRGQDAIVDAIARSRQELEYFDNLSAAVETASERDDLRELESQMQAQKLLPGIPKKRPRGPASRPRRVDVDGWDVLIGRSPAQNEWLSMKHARPEDWWLHARQIPGAHVILRAASAGEPPQHVLLQAARYAAGYSRAAADLRVPVDYTRVRFIKKPPGTPAGYVTYSRERTVMVEPLQVTE